MKTQTERQSWINILKSSVWDPSFEFNTNQIWMIFMSIIQVQKRIRNFITPIMEESMCKWAANQREAVKLSVKFMNCAAYDRSDDF